MENEWKKGMMTLIPKKNDNKDINNYRPIILLTTIYKIWATIMTNRLTPITNLLTSEIQCAYKKPLYKRYHILHKTKLANNMTHGQILLDLSRAFDRINRNKLWNILYQKGLPINFIEMLICGHNNTKLAKNSKEQWVLIYPIMSVSSTVAQLAHRCSLYTLVIQLVNIEIPS